MCKKLSFLVSCILVLGLVGNAWAVIGQKDIDSPGIPGSATEVGGVWTVTGSGHDIWGGGDAFYYVYRPMSGDGELAVKLTSRTMDPLHAWSKVGIMIRETSDTGSKHCALLFTAQGEGSGNEYQITYRPETGGPSFSVFDTEVPQKMPYVIDGTPWPRGPQEFRILRAGNVIQCWWDEEIIQGSPIRSNWLLGQVDIPMSSEVLIGLAVTSHDNLVPCTATYENVVWPAAPPYEMPWDMLPVDGTQALPYQPTLSWMRGDSAVMHDIYMGTDPAALPLVATRPIGVETYITDPLADSTWYYWQIVEQPLGIAGPVYSFKTKRPPGFGTIRRCVWEGIGGGIVADLTSNPAYPASPTWCDELTSMAYYDFADNYGARMQGYLVPETSGDYTFWIASDDASELWLSSDDVSCNAQLIASVGGWTGAHQWYNSTTQQSAAIPLVAGQKYFIRVLHKEGGGGDNCQVAWSGPDQPIWAVQDDGSAIIDGYFLQPADDPYACKPNPANGSTGTIHEITALSWGAGHGAISHDVYLGTDPGAMSLVATVAMPDTSCDLPPLALDTTYYWKVDAYDGTDIYPACLTWSFNIAEWISMDIGRANPIPAGSSSYDEGTGVYTLHAGGNELWGQADEFHYLYTTMEMTRNAGSIKARVLGIEHLGADWSRGGVQIRESRAPNARKVMTHKTAADNTRMQWREQPGWDTWNTGDNYGLGWPLWVRLDRDGEQFNGYRSYDGQNWTHLGGMWCPMPSDKYVCIGLALCHHNGAPQDQLATATFDNLNVYTADPLASWNPSPADGTSNLPLDVTLSWTPGENAGSHLLYISQNYEDVLYGLVSPIALPLETTEYNIGKLELGKPYYWCVDELRREGRDILVAFGEIWSFQVEPYRLLDDFESYCVIPEPLPEQVEVPGDVLVEAVPPPEQAWVDPQVLVAAVDPGADCLIAEWTFEGNFDDTSGSGFHGTPVGVATIVNDAERGDVLSLGGDQDYVDCGNPAALNFSTGDWTLSAWVKNTMTGTGDDNKGCIVGNGGDGSGGHRYCMIQSEQQEGEVTLVTDDNSSKKQARGDITKVNDDVWHSVIGIREGDSIRIYIDGKLEGSSGTNANYDLSGASQANVLIGAMTLASDSSIYKTYAGLIDDVQIYDCALTEGNVRYMAGIGDLVKDGYFGPCIVHWAMDEGSGDTAADSSGNDLHGAITDAAWTAVTADGSAACLDFNGFGGNVLNTAAGPILNNLDGLSISLWLQSDLTDTDKGFIMLGDSGSDRHGMRYDAAGGSGGGTPNVIKYGVATTGGNEEDESSEGLQTTEWQHVVMTWQSGTGMTLWINGIQDIPTFDAGAVTGVLTGYAKILAAKGSKDGAADASWDGRIDDVRIYDYRLSEGEVRYLAGVGDLFAPPSYQPLLAEFLLEGTADDTSGNNNHATPMGDATIIMDPVKGFVATFDGDGDAGNIGNNPLFNFTDDVTIAAWINMTSWGGNWGNIIVGKRGEGGVGWQLRRFSSEQRLSWTTRGIGNDDYPASNLHPSLNQWYHVAAVRDGTQKRLYIDGKLDSTADVSDGQIASCSHDVYIGARATGDNTGPEGFFNGMIDELRIYNTALTLEQIMNHAGCENPIMNTWFSNGSVLPQLDYEVAHGGAQSMKIEFGGPWQVMRIPPFEDWTAGNAKALTMYFKGDAGNTPGQMYAQLGPGCTVEYPGSPEDLMNPDWQEWNIALADFPCGASPATLMSVGATGGSGVLWFDDMRLYPSRCVPALSSITDLNQDCTVDGKDLRILAADYLMGDFTVSTETPDAAGLLAHYEFNDNYDDSSGNGNHGTPVGDGIAIEDDPTMGKVLSLPGGDNIFVDCNDVGISGNAPTTISCWAKADHTSIPDWTLVFGFTGTVDGGGGNGSHFNVGSLGGPGGVGAHTWGWEDTIFNDTEALEWRHYAMTWDGTNKLTYYGDGDEVGQVNLGFDLTPRADRVYIGSRVTQASSFPGKVDDARIYNYELSWGEVRSLAGQGDLYVPLDSIANIYDEEPANSKKVNLKDYALIGNDWLFEIVWP